jgi:hypothetical protein
MTISKPSRSIAALAIALVTVAACSSGGPTPAPTAAPIPTEDPGPGLPFPSFDLSSFDLGSFVLPSFSADEELEALLPDEIGGVTVSKQSITGAQFLALGMGGAALGPLLGELGSTADDLSVAIGSAGGVVVIAYQLDGVPAEQLFAGLEAALSAAQDADVTDITVGGRSVKQVRTAAETTYIYLADDVVFIIGGTVTPGLLEETVVQLPAG